MTPSIENLSREVVKHLRHQHHFQCTTRDTERVKVMVPEHTVPDFLLSLANGVIINVDMHVQPVTTLKAAHEYLVGLKERLHLEVEVIALPEMGRTSQYLREDLKRPTTLFIAM